MGIALGRARRDSRRRHGPGQDASGVRVRRRFVAQRRGEARARARADDIAAALVERARDVRAEARGDGV